MNTVQNGRNTISLQWHQTRPLSSASRALAPQPDRHWCHKRVAPVPTMKLDIFGVPVIGDRRVPGDWFTNDRGLDMLSFPLLVAALFPLLRMLLERTLYKVGASRSRQICNMSSSAGLRAGRHAMVQHTLCARGAATVAWGSMLQPRRHNQAPSKEAVPSLTPTLWLLQPAAESCLQAKLKKSDENMSAADQQQFVGKFCESAWKVRRSPHTKRVPLRPRSQ